MAESGLGNDKAEKLCMWSEHCGYNSREKLTEKLSLLQITRRMAIANGTCVSFCNQPKAHYLATSRESRRYIVDYNRFASAACRHLATSRESKLNFGLPWVRPTYDPVSSKINPRKFTNFTNLKPHNHECSFYENSNWEKWKRLAKSEHVCHAGHIY